jgi:hypothetical protein
LAQWNRSSTVTAVGETSESVTPPAPQPQAESSPKNIDLAVQKSDRLNLRSLSLVDPGDKTSTTAIAPNIPTVTAQPPAMASVNPQQAMAAKGTSNLSQALLPPSLQPQPTIQPYFLPTFVSITPPPVPSQQPQTIPAAPSPQSVSQTQPLSENPDPIAELSQRHAAEQRRLEGENIPAPTLFQQTRIDGISKQYQLDPNVVTRQYQQMQQQQVANPNNSESANQQPTPNNSESANSQPTPNNVPPTSNNVPVPDNGKPSVEIKNDGSVEIRSNSVR